MVEPGFGGANEPPYEGDFIGEWTELYRRVHAYLVGLGKTFGQTSTSDFWIVDVHYDLCLLQVEVNDLDLIRPEIIDALRSILDSYPVFGLMVKVFYKKSDGRPAPGMGLVIYKGEIVDELMRHHLPLPYRDLIYDTSRSNNS